MSLYFEAAVIIKRVKSKKSSIKNLIFTSETKNKKALYALVCETLKYEDVLQDILNSLGQLLREKALKKNRDLALILLYEHVLGKGVAGHFRECLLRHKSAIHSQCELLKIKHKVTDLHQLVKENPGLKLPKYVRVNTLQETKDEVIHTFTETGRTQMYCTKENFRDAVSKLCSKTFISDPHIPDLFVFESSTDFHRQPLYTSGEIILQDKASCFPAYILSPPPGSHVIDCCAAPGNKTSHLASLMQNEGKIFAFDKDQKRLETLKKLTCKAGASCIEAIFADFLQVEVKDNKYKQVEYILVDPSCSGSGMLNRTSQFTDETESCSEDRLKQLAKFQTNVLKHALSFPAVQKVVYSTCSIHEEENEQVVEEVLSYFGDTFELLNIEPDWPNRGVEGYIHAQHCLRMSHESSLTNGFFVACFHRKMCLVENNDVIQNRSDLISSLGPVSGRNFDDSKQGKRRKKKERKHDNGDQTEELSPAKLSKQSHDVSECSTHVLEMNNQDLKQDSKQRKRKKKKKRREDNGDQTEESSPTKLSKQSHDINKHSKHTLEMNNQDIKQNSKQGKRKKKKKRRQDNGIQMEELSPTKLSKQSHDINKHSTHM